MDQQRITSYQWAGRLSCFRATGCETCGRVLELLDEPEVEPPTPDDAPLDP